MVDSAAAMCLPEQLELSLQKNTVSVTRPGHQRLSASGQRLVTVVADLSVGLCQNCHSGSRQWCLDRVEGMEVCGRCTGGACTTVECPASGDALYPSQQCVLELSIVFASWCAGRSRDESFCTKPTEAASTGGCGSDVNYNPTPSYGRGVPACRWESDEGSTDAGRVAAAKCASNRELWLAYSGRR